MNKGRLVGVTLIDLDRLDIGSEVEGLNDSVSEHTEMEGNIEEVEGTGSKEELEDDKEDKKDCAEEESASNYMYGLPPAGSNKEDAHTIECGARDDQVGHAFASSAEASVGQRMAADSG